jgi:hypothetical protein
MDVTPANNYVHLVGICDEGFSAALGRRGMSKRRRRINLAIFPI